MRVGPSKSSLSGAGFKPPKAAVVKSHGGERLGKGGARLRQVRVKETNTSEPFDDASKILF
jgi:hypothetical protein